MQNKEVLVELAKSLPSRGSSAGRESSSRRPECEAGPSEHSDKFHLYEVPKIVQFIESETLLVDTRVCGVRMGVGRGGRSRVLGLPSLTERVGVGRRSLPAPSPETILPGAVLFELPHRHLLARLIKMDLNFITMLWNVQSV